MLCNVFPCVTRSETVKEKTSSIKISFSSKKGGEKPERKRSSDREFSKERRKDDEKSREDEEVNSSRRSSKVSIVSEHVFLILFLLWCLIVGRFEEESLTVHVILKSTRVKHPFHTFWCVGYKVLGNVFLYTNRHLTSNMLTIHQLSLHFWLFPGTHTRLGWQSYIYV